MYELARNYPSRHLKIADIAETANVPANYLEQLLVALKKEGLVKSIRGANGGYQLAKAPSEISIYMVLQALEGEFCISFRDSNEVLNRMWKRTRNQMGEIFKETLQDLVDQGTALDQQSMYFI